MTENVMMVKCQKCGKPIGMFTPEEMAGKIKELKHRPYKFCCDSCKAILDEIAKGEGENKGTWITYHDNSRNLSRQREAIVDIIKEWSFLKPTKEEEMTIKDVSKRISRSTSPIAILRMYDTLLEEYKR